MLSSPTLSYGRPLRNLCFTGESGIQELAGNGDSPHPNPLPLEYLCVTLRLAGECGVQRPTLNSRFSLTPTLSRWERGKSGYCPASGCGMTLCPRYDEGGRYDGVDVSAILPHPNPLPGERGKSGYCPASGCGETREEVCVVVLTQPSPTGGLCVTLRLAGECGVQRPTLNSRFSLTPTLSRWEREFCTGLRWEREFCEGSPLGEGAIRGAPRPFRAPPWVPDRVRQVDCCSRGYVCRLGLVGGRECPGSPIGVGEDESGRVGVSPSPQPSPAGRGGRVGTAPHRGAG